MHKDERYELRFAVEQLIQDLIREALAASLTGQMPDVRAASEEIVSMAEQRFFAKSP